MWLKREKKKKYSMVFRSLSKEEKGRSAIVDFSFLVVVFYSFLSLLVNLCAKQAQRKRRFFYVKWLRCRSTHMPIRFVYIQVVIAATAGNLETSSKRQSNSKLWQTIFVVLLGARHHYRQIFRSTLRKEENDKEAKKNEKKRNL